MEQRSFDALDYQLRDPVSAAEADRVVPVRVQQGHLDLPAVTRVDGPRRVHQRYPVLGGQPGAGMHERRVPVGQGYRDPGPHQGPFARPELDVLGRRQVRARVARMGVRRQRDAGVKALDQHLRLRLRQRRTPYWWHAR
jgi:hypothetical protein